MFSASKFSRYCPIAASGLQAVLLAEEGKPRTSNALRPEKFPWHRMLSSVRAIQVHLTSEMCGDKLRNCEEESCIMRLV
jgi:hypothetical protein